MFDIGGVELLVVAAVAILVVGPRELPAMLRGVGKFVRQAREMTTAVQRQFNDALKEAELHEVKKTFDDVRSLNPATQIKRTLAKEMRSLSEVGDSLKTSSPAASITKRDDGPTGTQADRDAKLQAASPQAAGTQASRAGDGSTLTQARPRVMPAPAATEPLPAAPAATKTTPATKATTAEKPAAKTPATKKPAATVGATTPAAKPARKPVAKRAVKSGTDDGG